VALTSLNFGVPAELGVDEGAPAPCEVVATPDEDAPDAADGAVSAPSADAPLAAVDRFAGVLRFADGAVDVPRFLACDEAEPCRARGVVARDERLVLVDLSVCVTEPFVPVAELVFFGAARLVFGAAVVVLVAVLVVLLAGLVVAGLVAAGAAAAGVVVAVLVVVVLVAAGVVALAEVVVCVLDGFPACCCATQVS
jgi:hypothetical protein